MATFRPGKPTLLLELTVPLVVPAATTDIPWAVAPEQDPLGQWSGGTPTDAVIERTGLYLVVFNVRRLAQATSRQLIALLRVDGIALARLQTAPRTEQLAGSCSILRQLVAGSIVTGAVSLTGEGGVISEQQTNLALTRVGPERWTS